MSWRMRWAAAQITPVLVSSGVWLLVSGLVPVVVLAGLAVVGAGLVVARTSRLGLWVRFGARPATVAERDAVLGELVGVVSLRGRGQPRVWVAGRCRDLVMVGLSHLLVPSAVLAEIVAGRLDGDQLGAATSFALGRSVAVGSGMVRAVELYCTPYRLLDGAARAVARAITRLPLVGVGWAIRPVVFGVAAVNAYVTGPALWGEVVAACVVIMLLLTYTTSVLRRRWLDRLAELGEARVAAEGFDPVWSRMQQGRSTQAAEPRRTVPGATLERGGWQQ